MSTLIWPGVVDAHVHLREPGATHKEDLLSGTRAALAGGVVALLDMPNNAPATTNRASLASKLDLCATKAVSDYGLFVGFDGHDVRATVEAAPLAVGCKLYLDQTFGDMTTRDEAPLAALFEAWPGPGPIAVHGESAAISMALNLAARFGRRVHICHVPTPADLLHIEAARQHGVAATCEVTPHHLLLTSADAARLGPYGQMKPPLVSEPHRALFWLRLNLVDFVASDHAPHTRAEKDSPTPPPGVPGLETTLPLLLYAVDRGWLSLDRLEQLLFSAPLRVYGLAAPPNTHIELDIDQPYRLPSSGYQTRCDWSPFAGQWALGRVRRVQLRGQTVWSQGQATIEPGYGRPLRWAR